MMLLRSLARPPLTPYPHWPCGDLCYDRGRVSAVASEYSRALLAKVFADRCSFIELGFRQDSSLGFDHVGFVMRRDREFFLLSR